MLSMQISRLQGIPPADNVQGDFALLLQMQQNCPWLHPNQHCTAFKPSSSYDFPQHVVLSIGVLPACFAIQNILNLCRYKLVQALSARFLNVSATCCHLHAV